MATDAVNKFKRPIHMVRDFPSVFSMYDTTGRRRSSAACTSAELSSPTASSPPSTSSRTSSGLRPHTFCRCTVLDLGSRWPWKERLERAVCPSELAFVWKCKETLRARLSCSRPPSSRQARTQIQSPLLRRTFERWVRHILACDHGRTVYVTIHEAYERCDGPAETRT